MKLVDTDIFVDFFRGVDAASLFVKEHTDQIVFSSITEAELLSGKECEYLNVKEKILHFLSQFDKIPVDNPLVQVAGDFRRKYGVALPDALIAASAFMLGMPIVTRNRHDFGKIKEVVVEVPY